MDFIDYYRDNLAHIRGLASDFAEEFPKIAARLELSSLDCQDPYIERLLEGTAFLAARVEKKLDDGFPRLLESILSSIAPFSLYPTPAMGIIELQLNNKDERLKKGYSLQAGNMFQSSIKGINTTCTFSTGSNITLYPLKISHVEYCTKELSRYNLNENDTKAAFIIQFECMDGGRIQDLEIDELSIFLNLAENDSSALQEQLIVDRVASYMSMQDYNDLQECNEIEIDIPSLSDQTHLFSDRVKQLRGAFLLQQFLICPALFQFIRFKNLKKYCQNNSTSSMQLVFALNRRIPNFVRDISIERFKLWCVPVFNLFKKNSSRCELTDKYEFHIVPERSAPTDYEVFQVQSLELYNGSNEVLFKSAPFYDESIDSSNSDNNFFSAHRRSRIINSFREKRSSYVGSEVFVSLSGKNWLKQKNEIRQLQATLLCTNRDLPLLIKMDSIMSPVQSDLIKFASLITPLTAPRMPLFSAGKEDDWKRISHISFNLSSFLWREGNELTQKIREMIRLYTTQTDEELEPLVSGIQQIQTFPKMFRFIRNGCVFFEDGWRIEITLVEKSYAGVGYFIFASLLKEVLLSYTPLNSVNELVIHTDTRKNVAKWMM